MVPRFWFPSGQERALTLYPALPSGCLSKLFPASVCFTLMLLNFSFTRDVPIVNVHSHNDFSRDVPLYNAIQNGCTGVEADIHLDGDKLLIAHITVAPSDKQTLDDLYVTPLVAILDAQNNHTMFGETEVNYTAFNGDTYLAPRGVFDTAPNQTLILMLDHNTDGIATFNLALQKIEPLRSRGYLTSYNTSSGVFKMGPVTVVASGEAELSYINDNVVRDIFLDAPLHKLVADGHKYNFTNSYYASADFFVAVGAALPTGFLSSQRSLTQKQINTARDLGLLSRYYGVAIDTLIPYETNIWNSLVGWGIGMLNVDDLQVATKWNWRWCDIMGLVLC